MDIHDDGTQVSMTYDSLEDFEKHGTKLAREYNPARARDSVFQRSGGAQWWGMNADAVTVMQKVRDGSPMFLKSLEPMMEQLNTEIQMEPHEVRVRRRKRHQGDYGDVLNMAKVYQGQLDTAWERPIKDSKLTPSERYASLFIDSSISWNITFDETLWRSAAALKICDILQQGGRNIEIYSGITLEDPYYRGPMRFRCGIRCKEYTQPLQPERLATMVSTAFFRTFGFLSVMATRYPVQEGLGRPMQTGLPKQLQERKDAGELVVRIGNCYSLGDAKRLVENVKAEIQKAPKDVH